MSSNYNTNNSRKGKHLTQTERQLIERWKNVEKLSNREIARRLNRCPQTINNEIKRGLVDLNFSTGCFEYSSVVGQNNYDHLRGAVGKTDIWSPEKEDYIKEKILDKISIEMISQHKDMPCCSTIYNWVNKGWIKGISTKDLIYPRKKKKDKPIASSKTPRKKEGLSIDDRPEEINSRQEVGHFEIDLVILNQKKGSQILTLVDRSTRYSVIRLVKDKTIESINEVMMKLKETFNFKSITCDNGSEFLGLDRVLDCPIYYAHPYASYERGSNENVNRMIRRKIPKGTTHVTEEEIKNLETWVNHYPRKLFDYCCPANLEDVSKLFNSNAYQCKY